MKKKIISLLLALVLVLSLLPTVAFAEMPSMQNVSISASGILSWDAVPGAAKYAVRVGKGGGDVTETSDDLNSRCAGLGFDTGDYTVNLYAMDSTGNQITETWSGTFHYVSTQEQLAVPTNLRFEGSTCKWDAVPHATSYIVALLDEGDHPLGSEFTTDTQYTFTLTAGKTYKFIVKARADGYVSSTATSSLYTYHDGEPTTEPIPITKVEVTGMPTPTVGESTAISASDVTITTVPADAFTVEHIYWWNMSDVTGDDTTFKAGKKYYLSVGLSPKEGYYFEFEDETGAKYYTGEATFNGEAPLMARALESVAGALHLYSKSMTPHTHSGTPVNGTPATCTKAGFEDYYSCACGKFFEESTCETEITDPDTWKAEGGNGYIKPTGHDWKAPTFTWAEDCKTCTIKFVCGNDASHVEQFTVDTTSKVKVEPTCEEMGTTTYTAKVLFNGTNHIQQKNVVDIPATGHDWGDWKSISRYEHQRICKNDASHVETEEHSFVKKVCEDCGYRWSVDTVVIGGKTPNNEENPNTGAPVLSMSTALVLVAGTALVLFRKKH